MKKSIIFLSLASIAFYNVSFASNEIHANVTPIDFSSKTSTPLCVAISKGEIELVKKFIEYGADINEKSNGMTPLMVAARYNQTEIITFLISKGAKMDEKDEKGYTALKYAEWSKANDAVAILKNVTK